MPRLEAVSRAATSSDEGITTVRVGMQAPRCVSSLSSKASTMPKRIAAFSSDSVGLERIWLHRSVDATTPCRGADCAGRHRRVMTGNSQPCSTAGAKARYNLHNERKLGADRGGRIQCGTLTCWAHEGKTDHDDSAHIVALVLFSPQEAKHRALPVTFSCLLFCLRGQACRTRSSPTHRPIRAYGMANPRRQCRRCRRNHSDSGRLLVARDVQRPSAFRWRQIRSV